MMQRRNHNRASGFTLVEVMVASVLVAIGIAGVFGGISALTRAQSHANDALLLQSLAQEKINDMQLQTDPSDVGSQGDFADRGHPEVTWSATVEQTSITAVDQVSVTTTRGDFSQTLTTQVYVPAQATAATTTTTTGTGATP